MAVMAKETVNATESTTIPLRTFTLLTKAARLCPGNSITFPSSKCEIARPPSTLDNCTRIALTSWDGSTYNSLRLVPVREQPQARCCLGREQRRSTRRVTSEEVEEK